MKIIEKFFTVIAIALITAMIVIACVTPWRNATLDMLAKKSNIYNDAITELNTKIEENEELISQVDLLEEAKTKLTQDLLEMSGQYDSTRNLLNLEILKTQSLQSELIAIDNEVDNIAESVDSLFEKTCILITIPVLNDLNTTEKIDTILDKLSLVNQSANNIDLLLFDYSAQLLDLEDAYNQKNNALLEANTTIEILQSQISTLQTQIEELQGQLELVEISNNIQILNINKEVFEVILRSNNYVKYLNNGNALRSVNDSLDLFLLLEEGDIYCEKISFMNNIDLEINNQVCSTSYSTYISNISNVKFFIENIECTNLEMLNYINENNAYAISRDIYLKYFYENDCFYFCTYNVLNSETFNNAYLNLPFEGNDVLFNNCDERNMYYLSSNNNRFYFNRIEYYENGVQTEMPLENYSFYERVFFDNNYSFDYYITEDNLTVLKIDLTILPINNLLSNMYAYETHFFDLTNLFITGVIEYNGVEYNASLIENDTLISIENLGVINIARYLNNVTLTFDNVTLQPFEYVCEINDQYFVYLSLATRYEGFIGVNSSKVFAFIENDGVLRATINVNAFPYFDFLMFTIRSENLGYEYSFENGNIANNVSNISYRPSTEFTIEKELLTDYSSIILEIRIIEDVPQLFIEYI